MEMEIKNNIPLVVVRCIVYNHEPYLRDCLEGILMQKTNFAFVVVVHDDASTDNSVSIIQEYAKEYPQKIIPVIEKENLYKKHKKELVDVLDKSCENTGAKYVAICEGDDYWIDPLKLQKEVDYMEGHPDCSLCGTNGFVMWEDFVNPSLYFTDCAEPVDYSISDLGKDWRLPTASIIYRMDVLKGMQEWNEGYFHGDLRTMLTASAMGTVHYMPFLSCVYRYSQKNLTSTTNLVGRDLGWAAKEMLRLYEGFDKWTKGKYSQELNEIKHSILKEKRYYDYRDDNRIKAAILMPSYTSHLIWKNIKSKIVKELSK